MTEVKAKPLIDVNQYDTVIVMFSGGKDSLACLLYIMEYLEDKDKIEIWHQLVDGWTPHDAPDQAPFMDWECTEGYCQSIGEELGIPVYMQFREGGFLAEASRNNAPTAAILFQDENWQWIRAGGKGKPNTREKFPQISASLSTRWCSSSLKIDVADTALRNQSRFNGSSTLVITGERREESSARAKYNEFEQHRAHSVGPKSNRHIDHWRPVIDWKEEDVWGIIQDYNIMAHPAYYLGWSRCSCKTCIFLNADGFASAYKLSPDQVKFMMDLEDIWGVTLKRDTTLEKLVERGVPYKSLNNPDLEPIRQQAVMRQWMLPIRLENWFIPDGAFGDASCGPS